MNISISKTFMFEASHVLPKHEGKCSRLHGHSWKLSILVEGPVDKESGFVLDYAKLKKCVEEHVISHLDHSHLGQGEAFTRQDSEFRTNQIIGALPPFFGYDFYPSSENLVVAIASILAPLIPNLAPQQGVYLSEVSLDETCTSRATWRAAKPCRESTPNISNG